MIWKYAGIAENESLVGLADNVTIMCQIQDKFNFTEEDFTNQQAFWTLCMVIGQVIDNIVRYSVDM